MRMGEREADEDGGRERWLVIGMMTREMRYPIEPHRHPAFH